MIKVFFAEPKKKYFWKEQKKNVEEKAAVLKIMPPGTAGANN